MFLIYIRFTHEGKVCSGDYLEKGDSKSGYIPNSGILLEIMLYAILATPLLTILAYVFISVVQKFTKPHEET